MADQIQPAYLLSKFPVLFPHHDALGLSDSAFEAFLRHDVECAVNPAPVAPASSEEKTKHRAPKTTDDVRVGIERMMADVFPSTKLGPDGEKEVDASRHPFISGLGNFDNQPEKRDMTDMMLTDNGDMAFESTGSSLCDLFNELGDAIAGARLRELLWTAWQADPLVTLKIIFNARSIHLGKASKHAFYRCVGWLAQEHPLTLLLNLTWLSRPVIEKPKKPKTGDGDDDGDDGLMFVEAEKADDDPTRLDARHGMSHGCWKDLLNILVLAVNNDLDVTIDPRQVLNVHNTDKPWNSGNAKKRRVTDKEQSRCERHVTAVQAFLEQPFYRDLHLTVARIFAQQLKRDLDLVRKNDKESLREISLCAKWAPSQKLFHDKHTFVVSSIAELLHPRTSYDEAFDRERYLRAAREDYRRDISALRKALDVVERHLTANRIGSIRYDTVPSLAMDQYAKTFIEKDHERFKRYLEDVAIGRKNVSGATLFPSKLIKTALELQEPPSASQAIRQIQRDALLQLADGQWKTLVERIRQSGTLEDSIAICDVSGSMTGPVFADGTSPLHSAIGLSLLVAEVTKPPFGGHFITFSSEPKFKRLSLDGDKTLAEKVKEMHSAEWGMSTSFVAVFEKLILPMAIDNKLRQEDLVKRVFVFSDMQFDQATRANERWTTSFERIKKRFEQHGYEMPEFVFWDLAGSGVKAKPVGSAEAGVTLVSGYSQGMLKAFMDGSPADQTAQESGEYLVVEADGKVRAEKKDDSLAFIMKAVGSPAYSMLRVFD